MDADDDDFGDFDAAPTTAAQPVKEDGGEDDAFGDFGAAPSQPEPLKDASEDKDMDDDDFGDFDAAPTLAAQPVKEDGGEDDAFGDFDAAPSQPESLNGAGEDEDTDDDGFGDFDAAPTLAAPPVKEDGGEDDAFGDFEDIPAKFESSSGHGDENFGAFDNTPGCDTPLPPIGTVTHGKRNLFAKMQALHSFLDPDSPGGIIDDNCVGEEGLIKFIASSKSVEMNDGFQEHNDLYQVFHDGLAQTKEEESTSIITNDGRGPYDCFVYPLAGFRAPRREFENERQLKRISSTRAIPDVLPIRLPSGKETPLETASHVTVRDGNTMFKESTKPFQIPSVEVPKVSKGSLSEMASEDVQNFRLKIPDLSFMLQSHLKLPTR